MEFLVGHMVGDYLLQNDWMAKNKASSNWHCLVHVFLYVAAINACWIASGHRSLDVFELWFCVGVPHFIIDRFRLARRYMSIVGQESFATGPMAPWSIVVVDQAMHAVCLFALWCFLNH